MVGLDIDRNKAIKASNSQSSGTRQASLEDQDSNSGGEEAPVAENETSEEPRPALPLQKRRRVTRACDECRRKKIKCDGKQPCTHCTVYSYECTYDQPSNRRRNPTPQYIEALEHRLHRAEALLKTVLPNIDLSDTNFLNNLPPDVCSPEVPPDLNKYGQVHSKFGPKSHADADRDSLLESMVKDTGSLDLDDEGHWDFHGHSSGMVFLQRLRQQFGELFGNSEGPTTLLAKPRYFGSDSQAYDSPPPGDFPSDLTGSPGFDLPSKEVAYQLCDLTMSDACCLMRFMHKPTFWTMFDKIYDTSSDSWGVEEHRYLPLLYAILAVGTMFAKGEDSKLQIEGYSSGLDNGFKWFRASRQLMEITDCRDIPSLQAIICMIMFLQSTAKLSTCWSYVGIALHSAIRMGLHRSISGKFNLVELELRRRLFWQIRKMDVCVGAMIGLPTMLSEDDFDQEYPLDIDDEFITPQRLLPFPEGHIHLMAGSNAQTRLLAVLRKVIKHVYPVKDIQYLEGKPHSYVVSHAKIREIERDLQHWMEELPIFLKPGGEALPELARVQQLLRMAYAYVQMFLYRPFLHYISKSSQRIHIDKRSYACAAACVSVSRNVIHITQEMSRRGLLIGSFWFTMYTTFLAIMALVFFALENPDSKSSEDVMEDARTGKEILAKLAKGSMAADRCTQTLSVFFDRLPERLKCNRNVDTPSSKRKSMEMFPMPSVVRNKISNPASEPDLQRASTFPPNKQLQPSNGSSSNQRHATYPNQPFPPDPLYSDSNSLQNSDTSMIDNIGIDFNLFSFANSNLGPFIPGYNIPDLAAIMFPSADPFAYPNQPMTTLENHTGFSSSDSQAPNTITNTVGASTTISSPDLNLYGGLPLRESSSSGSGLEAQLLDPLQPYLTIDYGQGLNAGGSGGFNPEMGLGSISNSVKDEFSGNEQEQKQEQQQQHQQQWWGQINNGEAMVYDPI